MCSRPVLVVGNAAAREECLEGVAVARLQEVNYVACNNYLGWEAEAAMRAVGIIRPGGRESLEVIERAERAPGGREVVIAVQAAGVNQADLQMRAAGGRDLPPWTPGMEAAGRIEAVGEDVRRWSVGDSVLAVVNPFRAEGGAQVERLVVSEDSVARLPEGISPKRAATLPMNGLTAMLALAESGVKAGMTLAVTGGAGHLAGFVIPLAKRLGAQVIADAKPADVALVRGYGADEVIGRTGDFGAGVRTLIPGGADAVLDTAAIQHRALPAVRDGGILVDFKGWQPEGVERDIVVKRVFVFHAFERTDWLEELVDLSAGGLFRLHVAGEFGPERAGEAHAALEVGGLRGRPVIIF